MLHKTSGQEEVKIEKTADNQNTAKHGTSIAVYNLFHNLSVRAKAMRADVEMAYVKDFMRRMSVLHHSINWLLVDKSKDRKIFHAPSHSSVAKRFISLHGLEVFLRMTVYTSTTFICMYVLYIYIYVSISLITVSHA